jgi:NAD(P)-dependent dehydrogenase (short-subunit alcohol dehydrogenase family)
MTDTNNLCNLEGKVAIVTGAGRGVGRGIATTFARAGASVVVAELDPVTAAETARLVTEAGRQAHVIETDATDEASVNRMVAGSLAKFGRIDVLVNNVGGIVGPPRMISLLDMELSYWEQVIRFNLTSQFLCCKACIKVWVESHQPGNIVNISSLAAMVPYKTSVAYGAAKAGVVNLTTTLANVYGKQGIRVNCIAPGHVKTPITDGLYKGREEIRAAQDRIIPLGRYGTPDDLGKVATFLASDASCYVTGQTLLVSGGMYYFLTEMP